MKAFFANGPFDGKYLELDQEFPTYKFPDAQALSNAYEFEESACDCMKSGYIRCHVYRLQYTYNLSKKRILWYTYIGEE